MTKLREIADKLGLPIGKEFRLDDEQFNKLVFKIDEEGNILFWNDNTVKFVLSSWSLIDVYIKGYVLVDENKRNIKDEEYYTKVRLVLIDYHDAIVEEIKSTRDIIHLSLLRETKWKAFDLIHETEKRLLNK